MLCIFSHSILLQSNIQFSVRLFIITEKGEWGEWLGSEVGGGLKNSLKDLSRSDYVTEKCY